MTDQRDKLRHPIQPVADDGQGILRFKQNAIVCHLLGNGGISLNDLHMRPFSREDWAQFHQLIGYSLSGCPGLDAEAYAVASAMMDGADERDAIIAHQRGLLDGLRSALREPMAQLFDVHPDDLNHD